MNSSSSIRRDGPTTEPSPAVNSSAGGRRRILVIDHQDEVRALLCDQLSALGFEVAAEDNGVSGLSRMAYDWEHAPFHGMLVELQMPVLGGLAVLQEMSERFPSVPVIAMSDAAHVGKLRQAVKLGAREYLIKPFDAELFRRKCLSVFLDGAEL
jgi:CheY-like chemotaxis protein